MNSALSGLYYLIHFIHRALLNAKIWLPFQGEIDINKMKKV